MDALKREEVRGLFTLGLLAILLVIRTNWDKMGIQPIMRLTLPLADARMLLLSFDFLQAIDLLSFCWIAYSFSMILGFSDDIIHSKKFRELFRQFGLAFFIIGPLIIGITLVGGISAAYVIYLYNINPFSIIYVMMLVASLVVVFLILRKYRIQIVVESK
jgi:hypothetical protein